VAHFPNTYTPAILSEALSFKTQQGTRGPVLPEGTEVKVRYDEQNGCFNASAVHEGKAVVRKDIPLRSFNWK
jgi:hypothetical protein